MNKPSLKRPFFRYLERSLRAKVTLGIVLPLLIILSIFIVVDYRRHREDVLNDLSLLASQSGRVIENNLRHAMIESDFKEVQLILDSIGETEDFRVIYLIDTEGKVIFAPNSQGVGSQLNNSQPDCLPCHRLPPEKRPGSVVVKAEDGQSVFRSMLPIKNAPECSTCHDPSKPLIGLLLTDIPITPVEAALADHLREDIFWWVGTILVTVLVVNLALSRIVVRRIESLAQALSSFGQDRLDLRLPVGDPDEIGQLVSAFNEMGQRIEAEAADNRTLSEHLRRQSTMRGELLKHLITAQEDERKRVARELHDDIGQALGALSLQAEMMEHFIPADSEDAVEQLQQTRALITDTTERMYDLILALRPSALDDLGLVAALRTHAERSLDGSGITFELNTNGFKKRLSPEMETAMYRVFQEALSNVRRHSEAKHVRIRLSIHEGIFESEVQDDGRGFDPQAVNMDGDNPRGLGLLGIKERVSQCGGQLEIISHPGSGTQIRIRIPLSEVNSG
jgi:signal transduction histidine kinase